MGSIKAEILVLPFFGQGHLFPCMELCKRFSSYHDCKSILIVPSNLSSSVPSSFRRHPFLEVADIPNPPPSDSTVPPPPPPPAEGVRLDSGSGPNPFHSQHKKLGEGIESFLAERYNTDTGVTQPVFAVIDVMMSWSKEIFQKFGIPIVSFFTSGACSSAIDYAGWVAKVDELKPGQTRFLDGLPSDMAIVSYSDLKLRHRHRPPMHAGNFPGPEGNRGIGPLGPGGKPRWMEEADGSIALFFNTCDDIDGPFISYLSNKIDKPVYGVGPLLPEHYWKSFDSVIHDAEVRSNRVSNYTEDQVVQWLDQKPSQSVIYVSFGSEVGPSMEEYGELSKALEESNRSFIWVIQPNSGVSGHPPGFLLNEPNSKPEAEGFYPIGLDKKVGDRGLIIKGWAPQLVILSHQSVNGFLSHCGWNSTVEAICRGVPILAWPIRGDQFHNANLVVKYLKLGHHLLLNKDNEDSDNSEEIIVKKSDIMKGIDLLMDDKKAHVEAMAFRSKFKNGFPPSSLTSFKTFLDAQVI